MRCRLDEADRIILLAEERLHEHNIIDENLSAMLAKVKVHSEAELRRFKEESEISYQSGVCEHALQSLISSLSKLLYIIHNHEKHLFA